VRTLALQIAAILCFVFGLATVWMPIPTGLVFFALGLGLLLMTSARVRTWMGLLRRRLPALDGLLQRAEPFVPYRLRRALVRTRARPRQRRHRAGP
jgi:hypothetical protein